MKWRARIVSHALEWLGTPYKHQASALGQGADCLGLLRGVATQLGFKALPHNPVYPQQLRAVHGEQMLAGFQHHCQPIDEPQPGHLLLFRMRRTLPISHCGILAFDAQFIHAFEGRGVISTRLSDSWMANLAAAFALPEPL
ncbi:MAG: C40 family peptidase [Parvularculaceae bacterium]|nr:C40 family peptidase [Parvularculaceae bacterium]